MPLHADFFDGLFKTYHKRRLVSPDPLQFLYRYTDRADREAAALICACFAYGNVTQILKNLTLILGKMPSPHRFILAADPARLAKTFAGFKYRFTTQQELCGFLLSVKRVLKKYGSLEDCFAAQDDPADPTVCTALRGLARELRRGAQIPSLVPDPDKPSALKRLNLFLRWMVRADEVDPGGWTRADPARLIVPLDVHMHRVAKMLGLTERRSADMKTAIEISRALARFCPQDPVKYDFCLTRFGIRPDMDETQLRRMAKRGAVKRRRTITPKRPAHKTGIA